MLSLSTTTDDLPLVTTAGQATPVLGSDIVDSNLQWTTAAVEPSNKRSKHGEEENDDSSDEKPTLANKQQLGRRGAAAKRKKDHTDSASSKKPAPGGWLAWLWRGPPVPPLSATAAASSSTTTTGKQRGVIGRARTFVGTTLGTPPATITNYLWYVEACMHVWLLCYWLCLLVYSRYPVALLQYFLASIPGIQQNVPAYRVNDLATFLVAMFVLWSLYSHGLQLIAMIVAICLPLQRVFQAIKTENTAELIRWCHYFILVGLGLTLLDDLLLLWFDHLWILPAIQIALCWSFCHTEVLKSSSYQTAYFWLMTKLEKVTDEAALIVSQGPPVPVPTIIATTDNNHTERFPGAVSPLPTAPQMSTTAEGDAAARTQAMMERHYQMIADTFPQGRLGMAAAQQQQQFNSRRGTRGSSYMRGLPPFRTPFGGLDNNGFGAQFGFPSTSSVFSAAAASASAGQRATALPSFLCDNNDIAQQQAVLPTPSITSNTTASQAPVVGKQDMVD